MSDLNFFKPYLGKKKQRTNSKIYIYGSAAIISIIIIGSFIFNTTKMYLLDKSINDYQSKLAVTEIQDKLKEAEEVNKETGLLKQYDASLSGIAISVQKRDNVSDSILKDISSTLPSDVSFKSLDITEKIVSIKGISKDRTEIAELKHNLSELQIMGDVYVNSIDTQNAKEGEYSFDIKCVLKDVG